MRTGCGLSEWSSQEGEVMGADSERLGRWQGRCLGRAAGGQMCRGGSLSRSGSPGTPKGLQEASCFPKEVKLRCQKSYLIFLIPTCSCGDIFFLPLSTFLFLIKITVKGSRCLSLMTSQHLGPSSALVAKNVPCHCGCLPLFEVSG